MKMKNEKKKKGQIIRWLNAVETPVLRG